MRCLKRLAKRLQTRLQLASNSPPTRLAERSAESDCGCKVSTGHIKSWKLTLEVAFPLTHTPQHPLSLSLVHLFTWQTVCPNCKSRVCVLGKQICLKKRQKIFLLFFFFWFCRLIFPHIALSYCDNFNCLPNCRALWPEICARYGQESIDYVSINWDISESDLCGQVLNPIDRANQWGSISRFVSALCVWVVGWLIECT